MREQDGWLSIEAPIWAARIGRMSSVDRGLREAKNFSGSQSPQPFEKSRFRKEKERKRKKKNGNESDSPLSRTFTTQP
jgi:hypothetical protein